MSKQTEASFFMFPPHRIKYGRFYQELLAGIRDCEALGERLVYRSEQAHAFREYDTLQELALILSNLPSENYRMIGQYYMTLGLCRNGVGSIDDAQTKLESLACVAPVKYRAKSLLLLSAISQVNNKTEDAFRFYNESIKVETFSSTTVLAIKGIAVLKSREGYHKYALKDLERFYPIARYASSHVYFDYLNSLAVELCEAGRLEEARNISNIVLASPYVFAYPEWRETREDIERKGYSSRSFVPVIQGAQHNIVRLPERESVPASQGEPGRVLHYDWESKMVKEPNDQIENLEGMDEKDLMVKLLYLATHEGVTEKKLRKVVAYALKVFSEPED